MPKVGPAPMVALVLLVGACQGSPSSTSPPAVSPPPADPSPAAPSPSPSINEASASSATGAPPDPHLWSFDDGTRDAPPPGFSYGRTGGGALGRWLVKAEAGAPSGANVLAQLDADNTNFRFPIAVVDAPVLKDVSVGVRCKMVSGRVDQACGLVARYRDENNYFVTRANALEGNIRLYTVKDGKRKEIASRDIPITSNVWHEYRLDLRGDHLEVFWNGQRVLDHHDGTFSGDGRAGVWTKADSITHFDDLKVEPLQ
jgi:hypothetical protein